MVVPCFKTWYTVSTGRRTRYECSQVALPLLRRRAMGLSRNLTPKERLRRKQWSQMSNLIRDSTGILWWLHWHSFGIVQAKAFCSSIRYGGTFRHLPTYPTPSQSNPLVENVPADGADRNDTLPGFSVSEVVFLSPFSLPPSLSFWLVFHPTSFDSEANPSPHEKYRKSQAVVSRKWFKIT